MKFQYPINNFTAGEWSPKMIVRTEAEEYPKASQLLLNTIVQMQGGAFKRPGFQHIPVGTTCETYFTAAGALRMFPWQLSDGSRYILIATDDKPFSGTTSPWQLYDEVSGNTIVVRTATSGVYPDVIHHDLDTFQYCQIGDIIFFTHAAGPPFFLRKEGVNFYLRTLQENYTTTQLSPTSGATTIADGGTWKSTPYGQFNSQGVGGNITLTGTFTVGGTVTMTASNALFASGMATYPCYFKFTSGGSTGVVQFATFSSSSSATATVVAAAAGLSATTYGTASGTAWEQSAWNGNDGYPRTITSYQGRLLFGGSARYPDTLWGSQIGQIYNFMEVPFAQDTAFATFANDNTRPFTLTPSSKTSSNIRALSASKVLIINTDKSEIVAYGTQGALGPLDVTFESDTFFGAEAVQPVATNSFLTFVQRGGRKLRDVIFSFQEDQYKSTDLMFLSDHLTMGDPLKEIVSFEMGSSMIWARTTNGRLLSVTLDRDYKINAWTHHQIGGHYNGSDPVVMGIASIPARYISSGTSSDSDSLYALIKITSNSSTVVRLVKFSRIYDPLDTTLGYKALDSSGVSQVIPTYMDLFVQPTTGLTLPITTWSVTGGVYNGYNNETVSVLADGKYIGELTISNTGLLTLPAPAHSVVFGYKYDMQVTPNPVEQGTQLSTPQGIIKRAHETYLRFWNTMDASYGLSGQTLFVVAMPANQAPLTDDVLLKMPPGYSRKYLTTIKSSKPLPCNILAAVYQGQAYD